jgi:nitrite reductase/ring-hydroxylating ferredoxin subunit
MQAETAIEDIQLIADAGMAVSTAIHNAILAGGEPVRHIADLLHGTWLGHPLHPVLTDITIGAWTLGTLFDAAAEITHSHELRKSADHAQFVGTISAIPTAITGIVDYSTFPEPTSSPATLHAVLNLVNFGLYIGSVQARRNGNRRRGVMLSTIGFGLTCVSAWIGGSLVYKYRLGVNQADDFDKPKRFKAVMNLNDLPLKKAVKVDVDGKDVMVYRDERRIYAIGAKCAHAAGPLEEGKVQGGCVECPWHHSVFDMRNGRVVHGPACQPQQAFDVRVRGGKVELRVQPKPGRAEMRNQRDS